MTYHPPAFDAHGRRYDPATIRPPADRGRYAHSTECRTPDRDPAWELLDRSTETWRRGPCGGSRECTVVEHATPRVPPPPRPSVEEVEAFVAEHGRRHVDEPELVTLPGDRWPSWVIRCDGCRERKSWRGAALVHYAEHGVRITDRPLARGSLADLVGVA